MAAAISRALLGSTVASLLLHALVAALIPALAWVPTSTPPVETISFIRVSHIQIVRPKPKPQARSAAPVFRRVASLSVATHRDLAHLRRRKASPPPAIVKAVSAAPVIAQAAQVGNGTSSTGQAAPQATATPAAREVSSIGNHQTGGYLPFGADQPDPVLDPGIRKQLAALGVHVTLLVTVGEDGRTKRVVFQPPVDPKIEKQIENLLADASWDPAVCGGGISCQADATIHL
jgi:hypothetical protein